MFQAFSVPGAEQLQNLPNGSPKRGSSRRTMPPQAGGQPAAGTVKSYNALKVGGEATTTIAVAIAITTAIAIGNYHCYCYY